MICYKILSLSHFTGKTTPRRTGARLELLHASTLSVADLDRSINAYRGWLDYSVVERGRIDLSLAASWGCAGAADRPYAVLQPSSRANVFIRLIENRIHPEFESLRSYGWSAIEICVQDVLAVHDRVKDSPFEVIGKPKNVDGLPAIFPMQVKGPDDEVVYLTQIREDPPGFRLPRANSSIDRLFILVLACSNMQRSLDWLVQHLDIEIGRNELSILYPLLQNALDLSPDQKLTISTMTHDKDIFLELDQMPPEAGVRPAYENELPQGIAIGTFKVENFDEVLQRNVQDWIVAPLKPHSVIYGGKRSGTLRAPDGTLVEVVEA